ncbi:DNA-directed DNA polymerase [Synchytrium endobioticum]|uniref:DNA-directed DNA polymerase n=1 Tax=Synchytrium endobioticum TaxID=286115 RepID=A0A507DH56_9FUNG|nr:DNA-directed DNA polymerase [Synchytrium endobioticum]
MLRRTKTTKGLPRRYSVKPSATNSLDKDTVLVAPSPDQNEATVAAGSKVDDLRKRRRTQRTIADDDASTPTTPTLIRAASSRRGINPEPKLPILERRCSSNSLDSVISSISMSVEDITSDKAVNPVVETPIGLGRLRMPSLSPIQPESNKENGSLSLDSIDPENGREVVAASDRLKTRISPRLQLIGQLQCAVASPDFGEVGSFEIQALDECMKAYEESYACRNILDEMKVETHTSHVTVVEQANPFLAPPAPGTTTLDKFAYSHSVVSSAKSGATEKLQILTANPLKKGQNTLNSPPKNSLQRLSALPKQGFSLSYSPLVKSSKPYVEDCDLLLSRPELGLPENVVKTYKEAGVTKLYEWQVEALLVDGVLAGRKNLVYSAPTSAGKTMVAELIMLKRVLDSKKRAIFILPFVSIVSEKTKYLQKMFGATNLRIVGYYASVGSASFDDVDIAVCTIEKANGIMNRLLEEQRLDQIGVVVVDELHMVGDESRGYLLELQLTKMQFVLRDQIQVIAMSATIENINVLASWLSADLYISNYRPVPLKEYIKINDSQLVINVDDADDVRDLTKIYPSQREDPDMLVPLVSETIAEGNSVLVFCKTKSACESAARLITKWMPVLLQSIISEDEANNRRNVIAELQRSPGGLDPDLQYSVPQGVAYHHAGLTVEERECIEEAFKSGYVRVLCATSTLATGVNLPARRVIFRTPDQYQGNILDPQSYNQMKGRAGRKGYDTVGESIMLCSRRQLEAVKQLIESKLQPVQSCLTSERKGLKRALLEVIAAGAASTRHDITAYVERSLLFAEEPSWDRVDAYIEEAMAFLLERELVCKEGDCCKATKLGMATVASSLSPEEANVVYQELRAAMNSFVLAEELHIVYQVTPTYFAWNELDWSNVLMIYQRLSDAQIRVAEAIGIDQGLIMRVASKGWRKDLGTFPDGRNRAMVLGRFFTSLMLADLVREMSYDQIMSKYNFKNRGLLQTLQSSASTFAGMVTVFCERLGWRNLQMLVQQFQDRLTFGVENELLELMRISNIKAHTARILWKAGYKTVASIACATAQEIHKYISAARPFKTNRNHDDAAQSRIEFRIAHQVVQGAQRLLEDDQKEASKASKRLAQALQTAKSVTKKRKRAKKASTQKIAARAATPRQPQPERAGVNPLSSSSPPLFDDSEVDGGDEHAGASDEEVPTPDVHEAQLERVLNPAIVHLGLNADALGNFLSEWPKRKKYALRVCARREAENMILEGLAVCWDPSLVFYLPSDIPTVSNSQVLWAKVAQVLSQPAQKYSFNIQYDLNVLAWQRIPVSQPILDPRVAAWALDPEGREYTLQQALNVVFPTKRFSIAPSKIDKCCFEATHVLLLGEYHRNKLEVEGLLEHVMSVEMPVMSILAQLELTGVAFEVEHFEECLNEYQGALQQLEADAHVLAGHEFSLSSPNQVAEVLYDELKLPHEAGCKQEATSKNKTKDGRNFVRRSTSKEVLERIADLNPMPRLIIEYRRISTILTNQLYSLKHAEMMHPYFRHNRILCEYDFHTATDAGLSQGGEPVNLRNAFQASPGHVLLSADYSQLELRIIAHMSGDRRLLELLNGGGDLFVNLAVQWHGMELSEVTAEIRRKAKFVAYGVIYGMGAATLANDMKIKAEEAESLIQNFRNAYEGIPHLIQRIQNDCAKNGYVKTLLGRKRYLPKIFAAEMSKRAQAQRQAVNTTIQGSAADLVKMSMIGVSEQFRAKYGCWYAHEQPDTQASHVPHMILQIHDELLFDVPVNMLEEVKTLVEQCMMNAVKLNVKIPVKFKTGVRWGEMVEDD